MALGAVALSWRASRASLSSKCELSVSRTAPLRLIGFGVPHTLACTATPSGKVTWLGLGLGFGLRLGLRLGLGLRLRSRLGLGLEDERRAAARVVIHLVHRLEHDGGVITTEQGVITTGRERAWSMTAG